MDPKTPPKKPIKESAMIKACEKCGALSKRSERGFLIAQIFMVLSAFTFAGYSFGLLPEEANSPSLLVLMISTGFLFYYQLRSKREYVCTVCKHKETIIKKT